MLCPTCQCDLQIAERQGIEIDHCPKCRGVWLDRGELDKIVERSLDGGAAARPTVAERPGFDRAPAPGWGREYDDDDDRYPDNRRTGRRRRGWLGNLFDFD
jgi:uncharacterized protein